MTTFLILTIILIIFGIGLLLAEMFLLPGFGVAGIFGLLSLAGAVIIAYPSSLHFGRGRVMSHWLHV